MSQCPDGTFSLSGDEHFYPNSTGNRKSIVSGSQIPIGMVLECNFSIQFQMGTNHGVISQSGVEILGYFSTGDDFLVNFSSGAVAPTGLSHRGVLSDWKLYLWTILKQ